MDNLYVTDSKKTKEQMFRNQLISGLDIAPITADAILRLSKEAFDSDKDDFNELETGQIKYLAVSQEESPGKPIKDCQLKEVVLTLDEPEDMKVYEDFDLIRWRRKVIRRICEEAYEQGSVLTLKDLTRILKVSYKTIRRDIKALEEEHPVPTRGTVKDMGPRSHKNRIVKKYLQGYTESEIKDATYHTLTSIERYIKDFGKVAILTERGENVDDIRLIVGRSERLVKEYVELYQKYKTKYKDRIEHITSSIQEHKEPATVKKGRVTG